MSEFRLSKDLMMAANGLVVAMLQNAQGTLPASHYDAMARELVAEHDPAAAVLAVASIAGAIALSSDDDPFDALQVAAAFIAHVEEEGPDAQR